MIYYNSRYLAEKLQINLAKWKRWSREFLDPDPLGGLQSGVARQFNLRDAFKVYLGGFLVSHLKFSIPEASMILCDLTTWLVENRFLDIEFQIRPSNGDRLPEYHVYIFTLPGNRFAFAVRTFHAVPKTIKEQGIRTETYGLSLVGADADPLMSGECDSAQVIAISALYRTFRKRIG